MEAILFLALGLSFFLGGLKIMTLGLARLGSSSLSWILYSCTGNRFFAFLCGLLFTALLQSSSLTTVMVVGAAEAGWLQLGPAIAIIIGANVGTTVTGQLLSFSLQDWALPLTLSGILLLAFSPGEKLKSTGRVITGFGLMLTGLNAMGAVFAPLSSTDWFGRLLLGASAEPLLGIMAASVATALLQSSSAVIGMVLSLAKSGSLSLAAGVSLIIGADVGTCVTALLAGLGSGLAGRRTALAHLLFNVFSVALILPFFPLFVHFAASTAGTVPRQLANAHTLYNLSGAVIMLIFLSPYEHLIKKLTAPENKAKKRILTAVDELVARWF